jgi:hypothetical protein
MHILPLLYNKIEYNWFVNEAETSKRKEGVSKLIHSLFLHKEGVSKVTHSLFNN